jgi:hypothetical protein
MKLELAQGKEKITTLKTASISPPLAVFSQVTSEIY